MQSQVNRLPVLTGIHIGSRGDDFKRLIVSLLKKGKLKQSYIDVLTEESNMENYGSAFTSELVDENNNYQVYEQLGDLTGNKFIVWYLYRRFPSLKSADGVKVVARLRINYGAKQSFCQIAENLGFWEYVSATNDLRQRMKKSLLEDVFEAFLGATESMLDDRFGCGVGYASVYKILRAIFDDMTISLKYEDLYDAKTRLKELFDVSGNTLGTLEYREEKVDLITISTVYRKDGMGRMIQIGQGTAALKADAQQKASESALVNLARQGYKKEIPSIYKELESEVKRETTDRDVLQYGADMNGQYATRDKNKYQNKYTSTVLGKYCRERDIVGIEKVLEKGGDVNGVDSEGMTCMDLFLIGKRDNEMIEKVLGMFLKVVKKVKVHRKVMDTYYKGKTEGFEIIE